MTNINIATGFTTTSKCNIVDSSGSLTIYNFMIINQGYINWNTGYGTFNKPILTANINGSYLTIIGSTVSDVFYFEGNIDANGISGGGSWIETFIGNGDIQIVSGTTSFIKG